MGIIVSGTVGVFAKAEQDIEAVMAAHTSHLTGLRRSSIADGARAPLTPGMRLQCTLESPCVFNKATLDGALGRDAPILVRWRCFWLRQLCGGCIACGSAKSALGVRV